MFYSWTKALDPWRIAVACRVPYRKVYDHIRAADLVDFPQVYGRFPRGYLKGESSLYSFLQSQRGRYRAGKLHESRKRHLDENLFGWLTPPKAEREHSLWERRLGELVNFVQENGRLPRYNAAVSSSKKVLAVWITRQRHRIRIGKLSEPRERRLNKAIPGWQLPAGPGSA